MKTPHQVIEFPLFSLHFQEGYFPDPENCNVYYFCTEQLVAEQYMCPKNYVFDVNNANCKPKIHETDCVTMKCTREAEFLVHARNATYYAFCDATLVANMLKCPTSQEFDKYSLGCKFKCPEEGFFPGGTPAAKNFCYHDGLVLKYEVLTCAAGYEFNASNTCVKAVAKTT